MTSKNWFFSGLKEDRKRRIWTIVIFVLLCFIMTAAYELNIEVHELTADSNGETLQASLELFARRGMLHWYLLVSGIGAALYGFQGFGWLTKREQVDFYHSQPMKREQRFLITYFNGFFLFEIPMLLHFLAGAVLIGTRGCLNGVVISNLLTNAGIFTTSFLMLYSLVVLAVMMTGNIIVSIMASGVFFFYPSAVRYLLNAFCTAYFHTFAGKYSSPMEWLSHISPVERLYRFSEFQRVGNEYQVQNNFVYVLVIAIVMAAIAFFLYKRRPSECAGKALAFSVTGNVIRILIVIPVAMVMGILFTAFTGVNAVAWLYFGTIFGALLAHGFMEVVFQFDIRAALNKKVQLLVSVIISIAVVSVFQFDLMGYDKYIPNADEVKTVSYYINLGEYMDYYLELNEDGVPLVALEREENVSTEISREEYHMRETVTEDAEPILALVKAHLAKGTTDEQITTSFLVCYELEDGKKVYREYSIDNEILREKYAPIYGTEEGKKNIHPYLLLSGKEIDSVMAYAPFFPNSKPVDLTVEEMEMLVECYKKDLEKRKFDQLLGDRIIGTVTLHYLNPINNYDAELSIYVSETYYNMIEFLEEKEISFQLPNEKDVMESLIVYNPADADETLQHPFWKGENQVSLTKEQREQVVPFLCPDEYMFSSYLVDYRYHFEAVVRNVENGTVKHCYYYMAGQDIPSFMEIE